MLSRKGPVRSINRAFPYLARGCLVVLAGVVIITAGLSVSTISSASSVVSPANIVDRSQKGDRLQLAPMFFRTTANLPQKQTGVSNHALPEGCESVSSPLARFKSADIGIRCLS
jgi:hypothetical protein